MLGQALQVLAQTACEDRDGGLVEELELELSGLLAEPRDHEAGIVHVADDDCANAVTDVEDVGNRAGYDHLVGDLPLRAHND